MFEKLSKKYFSVAVITTQRERERKGEVERGLKTNWDENNVNIALRCI